ncbi:uncharacterized protein MONBRDRAFT_32701 [Monosiga brevicollis MX1]|uniref:Non-canonical E2 ubiquitin-conjugating enzyme C-terminal domain-containing protein n=1 Tax=Monosiga brevicollis TaxID=81824 RepID=A9V166_MONBE|nr:uncharacterized protein MONBRDRAFT_32701 [Monosiga brevicollis MX1]EDQ88877.1 predicted protein [Monosiga brevicollis MX1]|eukprot:XP_001746490.1 hypothetical protein [Monosiga brevicollis MX1]
MPPISARSWSSSSDKQRLKFHETEASRASAVASASQHSHRHSHTHSRRPSQSHDDSSRGQDREQQAQTLAQVKRWEKKEKKRKKKARRKAEKAEKKQKKHKRHHHDNDDHEEHRHGSASSSHKGQHTKKPKLLGTPICPPDTSATNSWRVYPNPAAMTSQTSQNEPEVPPPANGSGSTPASTRASESSDSGKSATAPPAPPSASSDDEQEPEGPPRPGHKLASLLAADPADAGEPANQDPAADAGNASAQQGHESDEDEDHTPGYCIECEVPLYLALAKVTERPATLECHECQDEYCPQCFQSLHRKGRRAGHSYERKPATVAPRQLVSAAVIHDQAVEGNDQSRKETELDSFQLLQLERNSPEWFVERAKHIPVRLKHQQRSTLRCVLAALAISSYTDVVDQPELNKPARRLRAIATEITSFLTGIALAKSQSHLLSGLPGRQKPDRLLKSYFVHVDIDYDVGVKLTKEQSFARYAEFYAGSLEYVRRYKIMNPELMRTQYGKLIHLLQDFASPEVQDCFEMQPIKDIETVYSWLDSHGVADVLLEKDLKTATMEILPEGKPRHQIQQEIKAKESAQERIARKYAGGSSKFKDDIKWCLYSMSDNNSFLRVNRFPVDRMLGFLRRFFDPENIEKSFDLSIAAGQGSARLTHSHQHQYHYVYQTLALWSKILDDFFRLWHLAEQDLLDPRSYKLVDTGQGHQRQKRAPRIEAAMRAILQQTQAELGTWIGSSVIHLGDNNVPNALIFIDKYTQVAKILGPIAHTLAALPGLAEKRDVQTWIESTYGNVETLQKTICHDFFSKGFDGSGADNFYDAGSCIDGRLTSAWNWCQQLPQKRFYAAFSLAGFTSFDGEFQD